MSYLPEGCARPDAATLDAFWQAARQQLSNAGLPTDYEVRWIGLERCHGSWRAPTSPRRRLARPSY
jgi:hypothetical protein